MERSYDFVLPQEYEPVTSPIQRLTILFAMPRYSIGNRYITASASRLLMAAMAISIIMNFGWNMKKPSPYIPLWATYILPTLC